MSETFKKSQMSEFFDASAGCYSPLFSDRQFTMKYLGKWKDVELFKRLQASTTFFTMPKLRKMEITIDFNEKLCHYSGVIGHSLAGYCY